MRWKTAESFAHIAFKTELNSPPLTGTYVRLQTYRKYDPPPQNAGAEGGAEINMSEFFSRIPEPLIQEFYDRWCAKKRDDRPPTKSDFPLQEMPHRMWPHLFFYDHTDDNRFFCIHNGTAIVRYFGNESTGHYMDDHIPEGFANSVRPLYEGAILTGRGVYYRGDLPYSDEAFHVYSRMLLPLRHNETDENRHIIGIMVVTDDLSTRERDPEVSRRHIVWEPQQAAAE